MIDPHHIDTDILSLRIFDLQDVLQCLSEKLLGSENLMTAAKSLDFREGTIQRLHTYGHGIGIINNPGLRAVFFNRTCNFFKHGYHAQRPDQPPGACCIPNRLVNAVFFRSVYIAFHFVKGAGNDGNNHEIRTLQGFPYGFHRLVIPWRLAVLKFLYLISNHFISFGGFQINIIQINTSAHVIRRSQITHQPPCPSAGTAPYVGNLKILCFTVYIPHTVPPSACFPQHFLYHYTNTQEIRIP